MGGEPDTSLLLAQAQNQGWHRLSGCSKPRSRGAARWSGPRHYEERTGLAEGRPPLSGLSHPPGRKMFPCRGPGSGSCSRLARGRLRSPTSRAPGTASGRIPALLHHGRRSPGQAGHRARYNHRARTLQNPLLASQSSNTLGPGGKARQPHTRVGSPGPVSPA